MALFIKSIFLPKSIFHEDVFLPAGINLFMGRNGTGKSTLARTLSDTGALSYNDGILPSDCVTHIFDREFVDTNIGLYTGIPGIITVSSQNAQVYERILALKDHQLKCDSELAGLNDAFRNIREDSEKEAERFRNSCWNDTKDLRRRFEKSLTNKKTKQKFVEAISNTKPVLHDKCELEKLYDTVFSASAVQYRSYSNITNVTVLDRLTGTELLNTPFISSGDSLFSRFLKKINAMDWVIKGHDTFSHNCGNICPYCQQALPADFEEQLAVCFDEEYQAQLARVRQLYEQYRSAANEMYIPLQDNVKEQNLFPEADNKLLIGHMQLLKQIVKANLETIQRKIQSPSAVFTLEPTSPIMEQIRSDIDVINAAISKKNSMLENKRTLQNECSRKVLEFLAYTLQRNMSDHLIMTEQIGLRRNTVSEQMAAYIEQSRQISEQIRTLSRSVRDTSAAATAINELLAETGFKDFFLKQCSHSENVYEVVRTNGERVKALSDGEKRFLAFLYFYHLIRSEPETSRARVIVLDDPFAELDDTASQKVLSLINTMISDDEMQSFVFTCNSYCFHELAESVKNSGRQNEAVFCRLEKANDHTVITHIN